MGKTESTQKQLQVARERERNEPRERLKSKQSKSTSIPPPSMAVKAFVHRMEEVQESPTTVEEVPTGRYEVTALPQESDSEPETPAPRSKVACKKCHQALKARDYASKRAGVRLKK